MPRNKTCPACGQPLPDAVEAKLRPFCSKRCKMNDLSKWLGGEYRISSPVGFAAIDQSGEENAE